MLGHQLIQFVVMVVIGMAFNPMNLLAYRFDDLYVSLTLFYGGLVMAANMIWGHTLIHYFSKGHFNITNFLVGLVTSVLITIFLLRNQFMIDDRQYLRRMISHHSTALTTSHRISKKTNNKIVKKLADDIIETQEREIKLMRSLLSSKK